MTRKQQTILLAIVGAFVVLLVAIVGAGIWIAMSLFDNVTMDDVHVRFANAAPVLEFRPQGLTLARQPPEQRPSAELTTLHILRWNVHEDRLTRVELPFWLLRLRDSPIDVMDEDRRRGLRTRTSTSIRMSDTNGSVRLFSSTVRFPTAAGWSSGLTRATVLFGKDTSASIRADGYWGN